MRKGEEEEEEGRRGKERGMAKEKGGKRRRDRWKEEGRGRVEKRAAVEKLEKILNDVEQKLMKTRAQLPTLQGGFKENVEIRVFHNHQWQ